MRLWSVRAGCDADWRGTGWLCVHSHASCAWMHWQELGRFRAGFRRQHPTVPMLVGGDLNTPVAQIKVLFNDWHVVLKPSAHRREPTKLVSANLASNMVID